MGENERSSSFRYFLVSVPMRTAIRMAPIFRHRIVTPRMVWMATPQPARRQPDTAPSAVPLYRFLGILGTAGIKTAMPGAQQRTQAPLIKRDQRQEQKLHDLFATAVSTHCRNSPKVSAAAASTASRGNGGLTRMTRSRSVNGWLLARNARSASRTFRLNRLRSIARANALRLTTRPTRPSPDNGATAVTICT